MRTLVVAILWMLAASAPVTVERVREVLHRAEPHVVRLTGLSWPDGLEVERTDLAGLTPVLKEDFRLRLRALHPGQGAQVEEKLAGVMAGAWSRILRVRCSKKKRAILVSPGPIARLPEDADADRVLVFLTAREAVRATDLAGSRAAREASKLTDPERLRALLMVTEGRAEHYGRLVAGLLGVPDEIPAALNRLRSPEEQLAVNAGRKFVKRLDAHARGLSLLALQEPPRSTSEVFHPERFVEKPTVPDPGAVLTGLGLARVRFESELLLRTAALAALEGDEVERAFAGYLAGASARSADGAEVRLTVHATEDDARRYRAGARARGRRSVAKGRWAAEGADEALLTRVIGAAASGR